MAQKKSKTKGFDYIHAQHFIMGKQDRYYIVGDHIAVLSVCENLRKYLNDAALWQCGVENVNTDVHLFSSQCSLKARTCLCLLLLGSVSIL